MPDHSLMIGLCDKSIIWYDINIFIPKNNGTNNYYNYKKLSNMPYNSFAHKIISEHGRIISLHGNSNIVIWK